MSRLQWHGSEELIWDAVLCDIQREMNAHDDHVTDLDFTDDCTTLLSSGLDGKVKRWSSLVDSATDNAS